MDNLLQQLENWRSKQSGEVAKKTYLAEQLGLPSVSNYTNWLRRGSLPKAYTEKAEAFLRENTPAGKSSETSFIGKFRHAAPYIQSHRDRVFVIAMPGDVFDAPAFENIIHDLALIACLGVKLVIVHGARAQIERRLLDSGQQSQIVEQVRVTTEHQLPLVVEAINELTTRLISSFSTGMPNTPRFGVQLAVLTGNFVMARPMGVRYGVDFEHTGVVRQIQTKRLISSLDSGAIIVIPTLGYSLTGELFNLSMQNLVSEVAASLGADKLICFTNQTVLQQIGSGSSVIDRDKLKELVNHMDEPAVVLQSITQQLLSSGCRCHLVDFNADGSLLQELYTPEGQGLMVVDEGYQRLRPATIEDIGGILDLIRPLEDRGVLVKRSRDLLERYIDYYKIIECDGLVAACAALIPFGDQTAELSCIATNPGFANQGLGKRLVDSLIADAKARAYARVFVLTTEGEHWFIEQNFHEATPDDLPLEKKQAYNYQRNSKVLIRDL